MSPFLTAVNDLILSEQLPEWAYFCTQDDKIQVITKSQLHKRFGYMLIEQARAIQQEIMHSLIRELDFETEVIVL